MFGIPIKLRRGGPSGTGAGRQDAGVGAGAGQSGCTVGVGGALAVDAGQGEEGGGPGLPAGLSRREGGEEHTLGITWEELA